MAEPTAQTLNLAIGQSKVITVTMDAPPAGGVASWTVRFRIRKRGAASVEIEKTLGNGVTIVNATSGVWAVSLSGTDTLGLDVIKYDWSFWRIDVPTPAPIAFGPVVPYTTAENR